MEENIHIIDEVMFKSLKEMITSKDEDSVLLAFSIIHNINIDDEKTILYVDKLNKAFVYEGNRSLSDWMQFKKKSRTIYAK